MILCTFRGDTRTKFLLIADPGKSTVSAAPGVTPPQVFQLLARLGSLVVPFQTQLAAKVELSPKVSVAIATIDNLVNIFFIVLFCLKIKFLNLKFLKISKLIYIKILYHTPPPINTNNM